MRPSRHIKSSDVYKHRSTYLRDTSHRTSGELVDEGEGLLWLVRHDGRPADLGGVSNGGRDYRESAQQGIEHW
jgi:hypothetical protein